MADDWKVSSLLRDTRVELDKYSERVDSMLETTRANFDKDYSGTAAGLGFALCAGSLVLGFMDKSATASVAAMVGGVALISLGALMRRRTRDKQLELTSSILALEKEHAELKQRSIVLEHAANWGLPEVEKFARVRMLLGDQQASQVAASEPASAEPGRLPPLFQVDDDNVAPE